MALEFDGSIPIPIGTKVPQSTVTANSIIELQGENIQIQEKTDSGWPVLLTYETGDYHVGVAVDYLGSWHRQETGMEEVDIILAYQDQEWVWRAVVAFGSKKDALERGRYETDGYSGYELIPWNAEDRHERMEKLMDEGVTPIAYTEDYPQYPAHAMQTSDDIHALNRMFRIGNLDTLEDRREQLFKKIVPREVRWKNKDTRLRNLARDIEEDQDEEGEDDASSSF